MIPHSPAVADIRRRVLAEVRASPVLWDEYRRYRRSVLWRRLGYLVVALVAFGPGLMGLGGLLFLPCVPLFGMPPVAWREQAALLAQSACLTGLAISVGGAVRREVLQGSWLGIHALLPLPDGDYYRNQRSGLAAVAGMIALAYSSAPVILGWQHGFDAARWLMLAGLVGMQWLVFACVAGLSAFLLNETAAGVVGMILVLGGSFLGMPAAAMAGPADRFQPWIFAAMPASWVDGAFYEAVLRGRPDGWLFLIPVAVLAAMAVAVMRRGFELKELEFLPGNLVRAVPAAGLGYRPKPLGTLDPYDGPVEEPPTVNPRELVEAVRAADFVGHGRRHEAGWVDRLFAHWLTPREQAVSDLLTAGVPRWTSRWSWAALAFSGSIAFMAWPFLPRPSPDAAPQMLPGLACCVIFAFLPWAKFFHPVNTVGRVVAYALFPVGFRELTRVMLKTVALWLGLLAPFIAAWLTAFIVRTALPGDGVALAAAKVLYGYANLQAWMIVFYVSGQTDESACIWRMLPSIIARLLLFIAFLVSLPCLFVPDPSVSVPAAVVQPALSIGVWLYYRRIFHRRCVDLIPAGQGPARKR